MNLGRSLLLRITFLTIIVLLSGCGKNGGQASRGTSPITLENARRGFHTNLIRKESSDEAPAVPPETIFKLVRYPSPAGNLAAYVSPDPGDGQKHPLVIWLTGGFGNSISELTWADDLPVENDQSAAAYRKAGLPMMYPSLRGGNDNPGYREGLYGEVDDVLAAAEYAAGLPWVDASRIYLGGHSTGGTLALLTAEAAPAGRFRAVIAFGPVDDTAGYGQDSLPFNVTDEKECELRSPIRHLDSITCPTLVLEGENQGNAESLRALQKANRNKNISFVQVSGNSHFSILHPANGVLAAKILDDRGEQCRLRVSEAEILAAQAVAKEANFVPKGDLRQNNAMIGVVFYYAPEPSTPSSEAFKQAVEETMKGVPVVSGFKDAPQPPFLIFTEELAPLKDYPVPNEESIRYDATRK